MNARGIVPGLILVNLALAAGLLFVLLREPVLSPVASAGGPHTNILTRVAVRKVNSTNYFYLPSGFTWASLESTNYVTYIENLKAIGCPDATIRDIVIADIAKLYSRRRAGLRFPFETAEFWRVSSQSNHQLSLALRSLNAEQRNLVRQLLGVDLDDELEKFSAEPPARPLELGFIAGGRIDQAKGIVDRYRRLSREVAETAEGFWTDADGEQLKRIAAAELEELRGVLSPEEFREYELRYSPLGEELRNSLQGLNPTEAEFRKLFDLRKASDEKLQASAGGAGAEATEATLQAQMQEALGKERFERYQRLQEPSYQTLSRIAERFELSAETTDQAFDFLKMAQDQADLLLEDDTLDPDRRQAALEAISDETRNALGKVLGPTAFPHFLGAGGRDWLNFAR